MGMSVDGHRSSCMDDGEDWKQVGDCGLPASDDSGNSPGGLLSVCVEGVCEM